jgi:hypothetical protein
MKTIAMTFSAALLMLTAVTDAGAIECAEGARHAGCVGREGAVAVDKPVHKEVVEPRRVEVVEPRKEPEVYRAPVHEDCRMIDGRRVCR